MDNETLESLKEKIELAFEAVMKYDCNAEITSKDVLLIENPQNNAFVVVAQIDNIYNDFLVANHVGDDIDYDGTVVDFVAVILDWICRDRYYKGYFLNSDKGKLLIEQAI